MKRRLDTKSKLHSRLWDLPESKPIMRGLPGGGLVCDGWIDLPENAARNRATREHDARNVRRTALRILGVGAALVIFYLILWPHNMGVQ